MHTFSICITFIWCVKGVFEKHSFVCQLRPYEKKKPVIFRYLVDMWLSVY